MAATESTMLPLGTRAPSFCLPLPSGEIVDSDSLWQSGVNGMVVMFLCNHCPFVIHLRQAIAQIAASYQEKGFVFVAINSNDVANYPDDSPEKMEIEIAKAGYRFPYLYDESQDVAKAYAASCTPDFFVFDGEQQLIYRGQFDESRPGNNIAVSGADLCAALDALVRGESVPELQRPSIGCNIKWKPGNEPEYFGNG